MDLATIEVPAEVARREFLAYRESLRTERDERQRAEDEQLMRAYRAAARGARLIRLSDVLKAGGMQSTEVPETTWEPPQRNAGGTVVKRGRPVQTGRMLVAQLPRLAVARADVERVYCRGINLAGGVRFTYVPDDWQLREAHTRKRFDVANGTFDVPVLTATTWPQEMAAMAPNVPPALRPRTHLRNYHLLWEADWKRARQTVPPGDPALLHHVGGDLYAVLACWDLTPLEQAVLAGTRG